MKRVNAGGVIQKPYIYAIGIDPGTKTGYAVYDRLTKQLLEVKTVSAHEAWDRIRTMKHVYGADNILVRWEDCRLRKWYGNAGKERLKGVGSVERDCSLWQDFLKREGIRNQEVAPKNIKTKATPDYFAKLTGWDKSSSEHSRDAALLVYGF